MIFLVQNLRKPENVSAWHPEKRGHDTLSMYKRACPRLGLSYLTPNGSTRLFQIIIWVIFQNVTSFWCTVLIWPDCPLSLAIIKPHPASNYRVIRIYAQKSSSGGKSIFWFLIIILFGIDFVLIFLPLETNTKTCLETKFQTRPRPRLVLK